MAKKTNRFSNYVEDDDFPQREKTTTIPEITTVDLKKFAVGILRSEIKVQSKNDSQKELLKSIKENEITICHGKPGSGKTYLAVVQALKLLKNPDSPYKKIYLVKSVQPLKGENLGFIKGTLQEKILPSAFSFFINIEKVIGKEKFSALLANNVIEPFPLTYIRGCSLDESLIVADECQNINQTNLKTLMSRLGENSKLIMLGDIKQIDLKDKEESGFTNVINMFKDVENIGVVEMNPNDISIRNPLIDIIETKFDEFDDKQKHKNKKREVLND